MRCYLFDLDGTLCNIEHRLHYIVDPQEGWPDEKCGGVPRVPFKKDWDAFYAACVGDTPIEPICQLVRHLHRTSDGIVIASGRVRWSIRKHHARLAICSARASGILRNRSIAAADARRLITARLAGLGLNSALRSACRMPDNVVTMPRRAHVGEYEYLCVVCDCHILGSVRYDAFPMCMMCREWCKIDRRPAERADGNHAGGNA